MLLKNTYATTHSSNNIADVGGVLTAYEINSERLIPRRPHAAHDDHSVDRLPPRHV